VDSNTSILTASASPAGPNATSDSFDVRRSTNLSASQPGSAAGFAHMR